MACLPRSLLTVSSSLVECSLEERLEACRRLAVESLESPRRFWLREAGLLDWLRSPDEAGFLEIPHIGHQGGSSICLSRHSKNPDAAWIFLQWVCSKNVAARSAVRPASFTRVGPEPA